MNSPSTFVPAKQLNTAVLFLVFNRLDTTKQVFEEIKAAMPSRFYIACDGARENKEGEGESVDEIRNYILDNIDWPCDVKTLFRPKNLGCKIAVSSAIGWFFEHEEMGIIFEDDTLPDPSFFPYCEELLLRYKDDNRVGMISGNNHVGYSDENCSYMFSKHMWTWGWATWRRVWGNYDIEMNALNSPQKDNIIRNMGYGSKESKEYWEGAVFSVVTNKVNTWDYQWFITLGSQNQLCIFPNSNLVANIGFGADATHCLGDAPDRYTHMGRLDQPLKHPKYVVPNYDFEKYYESILMPTLYKKIINKLKSFRSF